MPQAIASESRSFGGYKMLGPEILNGALRVESRTTWPAKEDQGTALCIRGGGDSTTIRRLRHPAPCASSSTPLTARASCSPKGRTFWASTTPKCGSTFLAKTTTNATLRAASAQGWCGSTTRQCFPWNAGSLSASLSRRRDISTPHRRTLPSHACCIIPMAWVQAKVSGLKKAPRTTGWRRSWKWLQGSPSLSISAPIFALSPTVRECPVGAISRSFSRASCGCHWRT